MSQRAKMKAEKIEAARAFAWEVDNRLCHWAEPTKARLQNNPKPSTESKIQSVVILRLRDYKKLVKRADESK